MMATDVSHPAMLSDPPGTPLRNSESGRQAPVNIGSMAGSNATAPERRSHHKPRKFSTFMKRLANLKSSSVGPSTNSRNSQTPGRSASFSSGSPSTKQCLKLNHPPSLSRASSNGHLSFDVYGNYESAGSNDSITSTSDIDDYEDGRRNTRASTRSWPARSTMTATTATATTASTFSSPAPSMRSLTTTLTTIQSTAPGSVLNYNYNPHPSHHHNPNGPPQMYSAPFDTNHNPNVQAFLHPVSYNTATAHGVWSDNASIITLASSSKHRRRSFDTDASVRALAPSSVFGGSRESLPLSVLSGNLDSGLSARSIAGERLSLQGSTIGRSSDTMSINGTTGSIMGEISGVNGSPGSPLSSPLLPSRDSILGRHSRHGSGWAEAIDDDDEEETRSFSIRSASLKDTTEDHMECMSIRDGSSNVGVWNGVIGKPRSRDGTGSVRE